MTWNDWIRTAIDLFGVAMVILGMGARVVKNIDAKLEANREALRAVEMTQKLQAQEFQVMREDFKHFRDREFHDHMQDDKSSFSSLMLRVNGLAEKISGALAVLGFKERPGMAMVEERE